MKSLTQHITEKLVLAKDTKINRKHFEYTPKTLEDLLFVIKRLLAEQGEDADMNCIDTSYITDMSNLFNGFGDKIKKIKISEWDVSNVTNMNGMFKNCNKFNCDL